MDIPVISRSILRPRGIMQPVAASAGVGAITPESHPFGNHLMKNDTNRVARHPRNETEQVDISGLARLLSKRLREEIHGP